jgi:hypothetical protein
MASENVTVSKAKATLLWTGATEIKFEDGTIVSQSSGMPAGYVPRVAWPFPTFRNPHLRQAVKVAKQETTKHGTVAAGNLLTPP